MSFEKVRCLVYEDVEQVPASVETLIVEKSFEANMYVTNIECSGGVYALFHVEQNGKRILSQRSGPSRNVSFVFPLSLFLGVGDRLTVKVIHFKADQAPEFECGVFGYN